MSLNNINEFLQDTEDSAIDTEAQQNNYCAYITMFLAGIFS